jgi:hypothetical protein
VRQHLVRTAIIIEMSDVSYRFLFYYDFLFIYA